MARLDDDTRARIDSAPARHVIAADERLTFGAAADDFAAAQNDAIHSMRPDQRPVMAASMHSPVVPNQASMPMIAGR